MSGKALLHFMRAAELSGLLVAIAVSGFGCSRQPKDDWYERSSRASAEEARYIEIQHSQGVSETDAKAIYAGRLFWDATEGRDKKFVLEKQDIEMGNPGREVPR